MTTEDQTEIGRLQNSVLQTIETFQSANKLLELNKELLNKNELLTEKVNDVKKLQREFLLDSFRVNRFHKDYKEWENKSKDTFIENEIKGYNNKLGQMSRLNFETEKLDKEYEGLRDTVKLPECRLSIQTIKLYNDGLLLKYIEKNSDGEYPQTVDISELFSLDSNSKLPQPDFTVFNRLLNIEYKLRIQRKVKYEILLSVKQQLTAKNKKWSSRDSDLNYFMTRKLVDIMNEVEKVRKSEYEDLKDYDYYNNEEEEEEMREQEFEDDESVDENQDEDVLDDDESDNENNNSQTDNPDDAVGETDIVGEDDTAGRENESDVIENQMEMSEEQPSNGQSNTDIENDITVENSPDLGEKTPTVDPDDNDDVMNIDS
ncbi:uncharacterized protein AC631_05327 [Debaryomyces fabryi]|uniref:Uncharacterized protein n=1 Tax=Debaryomyces fabryi TaxID=58627 RepID=A0A0V1PRN9_9ASCO|nr:uncharacterized protein AC631_05327 [Debaryomyces fabryi]KRZ98909.1 hypothetical protein AC631_05327 [Debaryomyces fabryi]